MGINVQEAGTIEWKLRADLKGFDKDLAQAQDSLDKTVKKGSEKLDIFKGKFLLLGAAAIGAAYMMIKASPSLSFGMQEIGYRFEYIAAIIGEQFAPILMDVLIPALDALIPIVERFAPMIGEVVAMIVTNFAALAPVFDRVLEIVGGVLGRLFERFSDPKYQEMLERFIGAIVRIADSLLDIAEPALDAFFDILEVLSPLITTYLIIALETFATVLETVAGFVVGLVNEIKGNDKLMGFFEKLASFISVDLVHAIEILGGWITDMVVWFSESGLLGAAIGAITWIFEGVVVAIELIWGAFETLGGWISDAVGWLDTSGFLGVALGAITWVFEQAAAGIDLIGMAIKTLVGWIQDLVTWIANIDFGLLGEAVGFAADVGGAILGGLGDIGEAVLGQHGGRVVRGGKAEIHTGEVLLSAPDVSALQRGGGRGGGVYIDKIIIPITVGSVSSSMDIRKMARLTATELKYELERKVFI